MSKPRSVILLFVDGVGVGPRDPSTNPFARFAETRLGRFWDEVPDGVLGPDGVLAPDGPGRQGRSQEAEPASRTRARPIPPLPLLDGGFWKPLDATLGVPGLPQSATGQATILTGVNAPRRVGRHVSAIPDRRVRELLEEDNLFRMLRRRGRLATFANAYTPAYFARKRPHISATTRSLMAADIPLRRLEDLMSGHALFHDYTNEPLRMRLPAREGSPAAGTRSEPPRIPSRSAEEAAEILFGLAREHDFTLHEHFLTDLAGHRGTDDERLAAARRIEELVEHLARGAALHETLVLVVSDHGNLEDLRTHTHTMNPVPFLAWGPGAERAMGMSTDLTDVTPVIISSLGLDTT